MTTGLDVVKEALKKAGVTGKGRAPDAEDTTSALADLNDMIQQWNTQRWIIWEVIDKGVVSNGGNSYPIGPGAGALPGGIELPIAPRNLKAAYVKLLQTSGSGLNVNQPLEVIPSLEEYSRLSLPQLVSFPQYVYLQASYPIGTIKPYPLPNATIYEIHVIVQNPIIAIDLNTDLSVLPGYYIPAFKFNLAQILRQAYGRGRTRDSYLDQLASNSMEIVINANLQISELVMPKVLVNQQNGYNIFSDQFGNG